MTRVPEHPVGSAGRAHVWAQARPRLLNPMWADGERPPTLEGSGVAT